MADDSSSSLIDTLQLALTQCQKQIQIIQHQASQIEQLQRENEVLRQQLEIGRQGDTAQVRDVSVTIAQAQDLFQQNINAQSEIKQLHKRLKKYKEKVHERLQVPLSSPIVSSPVPSPVALPPSLNENWANSNVANSSHLRKRTFSPCSPPRKRFKSVLAHANDMSLQTSISSTNPEESPTGACGVRTTEQGSVSLQLVRGNNVDQAQPDATSGTPNKDNGRKGAVNDRLDALLTMSRPTKSPLPRPRSSTSGSSHAHIQENTPLQTSKASLVSSVGEAYVNSNDQSPPQPMHSNESKIGENKTGLPLSSVTEEPIVLGKLVKPMDKSRGGGPLRRRPLQDLSLYHFKRNPSAPANSSVAVNNRVNNGQSEYIKAHMKTNDNRSSNGRLEVPLSDHEVLLEFLGAGSEPQIARLSLPARSELLSKARRAQAANAGALGNIECDFYGDAPGFWSADMPGTQEDINNKNVAKQRERKEIELRYHDAMTSRERWIFVDE